jgi:hypothetical protein
VAAWWSIYVEANTPTFAAAGDDGAVLFSIAETLKAVSP